jgi:hypothetical protein
MPVLHHSKLTTPDDRTVIWRYMDIAKFLDLLERRSLYFAPLVEFSDKWEGVIAAGMTNLITSSFNPGATGGIVSGFRAFGRVRVRINCWYMDTSESVAMWSLYTVPPYGIAIESDVASLKTALDAAERDVNLGQVEYLDYDDDEYSTDSLAPPSVDAILPIVRKRNCYRHECELRAITWLGDNERPENPPRGISVPVDLRHLIKSITFGPEYPSWAQSIVVNAIKRAGLGRVSTI